jgi:hypothetical protein
MKGPGDVRSRTVTASANAAPRMPAPAPAAPTAAAGPGKPTARADTAAAPRPRRGRLAPRPGAADRGEPGGPDQPGGRGPYAPGRGAEQHRDRRGLVLSSRTIDNHVAAIFRKLGVRKRADAREAAQKRGLV